MQGNTGCNPTPSIISARRLSESISPSFSFLYRGYDSSPSCRLTIQLSMQNQVHSRHDVFTKLSERESERASERASERVTKMNVSGGKELKRATDLGRVHDHGCADLPVHIGTQVDGSNLIHGCPHIFRDVDDLHVTTSSATLTCNIGMLLLNAIPTLH